MKPKKKKFTLSASDWAIVSKALMVAEPNFIYRSERQKLLWIREEIKRRLGVSS